MSTSIEIESILDAAASSWKILQGSPVGEEEMYAAWRLTSGSHPGNLAERLSSLLSKFADSDFIESQPAVPQVREKWRPKFESGETLSIEDAISFQIEVSNALELMDKILGTHSLSAVTYSSEGSANDVITRRPSGKLSGWSLNLTVSGAGLYNCIRQELRSGPGHLVLLSPDAMYDYQRAPDAPHWTHNWIYFQPDEMLLRWINWAEVGPHIYHLSLPESEFSRIRKLFEDTLEFDPTESEQSLSLLHNITEQIFIRCANFRSALGHDYTDARIKSAMNFIEDNLDQPFTVDQVAQHVQLSKTQISTLFKENTGNSIISWREERRITRASRLLTQTSQQIQEIAKAVGYEDPLYFSRTFSRLVGCSPREFRRSGG